jgi:hypothetical protein
LFEAISGRGCLLTVEIFTLVSKTNLDEYRKKSPSHLTMSVYSNPELHDLKPNNLNIFFDYLELWIARVKVRLSYKIGNPFPGKKS